MSRELLVRKIREGTVIDHIPAGRALDVLKVLKISGREGFTVAVVMNVESKKLGRKDIIKIEGKELKRSELDVISIVAPTATINIIREYEVVDKFKVKPPQVIEGLFRCRNPNCITNQRREPIKSRFTVIGEGPVKLKCDYCGEIHEIDEVVHH